MAQLFVSHSSKDKELVSTLAQDLETTGYQVWFDHKLTGGQTWWEQILMQIRACDLFIFVLTPDALDSVACRREYGYAHNLNKNILPVLLSDGVSVNLLPPELTMIQFVDYRSQDRQAAFRLINALNQLPPARPLPDPLPPPPEVPISYLGSLKEQIDSPKNLSFEDQTSLVFKLKEYLQDETNRVDAITLMNQLRKRDDLYAKIGEEIDTLLAGLAATANGPGLPLAGEQRQFQDRPTLAPTPPNPGQPVIRPPEPVTGQMPATSQGTSQGGTVMVQPQSTTTGQAWSNGVMIALVIGTLFIPLVGLVSGAIALRSQATRNQGIGLLVFGVIMVFLELSVYGY